MRLITLLLLLLAGTMLRAQVCPCIQELNFVRKHIEQNHGGFKKRIKSPDDKQYKAFVKKLEKEIRKDTSGRYCIALLKKYMFYLQDHHSDISELPVAVNEDDSAAVQAFFNSPIYKQTEWITPLPLADASDPLQGDYTTADSSYVVRLIRNPTTRRDYAGVILSSKTPLWKPGQVKFELKKENDSLWEVYTYMRNHQLMYDKLMTKEKVPALNGWYRTGVRAPRADNGGLIQFTIIDSQTTMLSITRFNAEYGKKLEEAYQQYIPQIKAKPYFILDVRNNGGGSDQSYKTLMELIYTGPFDGDVMEYYATPANIRAYEDFDASLRSNPNAEQDVFKYPIALMRQARPYSFIAFDNGKPERHTYKENKGYPLKVAVLYNRGCASSCESLLIEAMHSNKTILVGENSGGYTGYGNVMRIQTPQGRILRWTTTVYREEWKYEFVGIPPHYRVPAGTEDWADYTRRLMQENNSK
jgi:hypothetical protein